MVSVMYLVRLRERGEVNELEGLVGLLLLLHWEMNHFNRTKLWYLECDGETARKVALAARAHRTGREPSWMLSCVFTRFDWVGRNSDDN